MTGQAQAGALSDEPGREWQLCLYISGQTPHSLAAIANLSRLCEENLLGRYAIELIDVMQNADRAREDQIVAIPTLIRRNPLPALRLIGDLSDTPRILSALKISPPTISRA